MIIAAPAFETEQVITASGFILGLLLFGIALVRAHGVPRRSASQRLPVRQTAASQPEVAPSVASRISTRSAAP